MTSIYEKLVAAGCEIDHYESDLFVRRTPHALETLRSALGNSNVPYCPSSFFDSKGQLWIEIPFAYDPYWEKRTT